MALKLNQAIEHEVLNFKRISPSSMNQEMAKDIAPKSGKNPFSLRLVFLFLFLYGLMHLNPQVASLSNWYNANPLGPQIVLAEEDEEDEEEEEEEDEEDEEEEEDGEEFERAEDD